MPQLDGLGRLDVHVAVDEHRRGAGCAVPLSKDGGMTWRLPRLNLDGTGLAQPLRNPIGRAAHIGGVGGVGAYRGNANELRKLAKIPFFVVGENFQNGVPM